MAGETASVPGAINGSKGLKEDVNIVGELIVIVGLRAGSGALVELEDKDISAGDEEEQVMRKSKEIDR